MRIVPREAAKGNSRKNRKKAQKGKRAWFHADGVAVLPIFALFCGSCGKIGLRPVGAQGGDLLWGSGGVLFDLHSFRQSISPWRL